MIRGLLKLLLALGVIVVLAMAVNHVLMARETKPAQAAGGRIVKVDGGDLHVRDDGPRRAPVLVALHGFSASLRWWDPSMSLLTRRYRVIRIDLLGHGGSAKPRSSYAIAEQARLVGEVLERLKVSRALVAGHSMGGAVATALAEERPELVTGLVVIGMPPSPEHADLGLTAKLATYPLIGPALRRLGTDDLIYEGMSVGFAPGFRFPRALIQDYKAMTFTSYDRASGQVDEYVDETSLDRRLAASGKPVLVLFGAREQIVKPAALRFYRAVPGARVYTIPDAGHSPMFESPLRTARLMLAFGRTLRTAGGASRAAL